ncbi:MAG: PTS fructose transporter subunit IIA [Pseudomonadota bacterium]
MISLIILAQQDLGKGLLSAIEHVLGTQPSALDIQPIDYHQSQESLAQALAARIQKIDQGDGVLILADIYGSSHTNAACRLLVPGRVELVSGVNLPMLVRVLNYRNLTMDELVRKAQSGGAEGIVRATPPTRATEGKR